MDQLVWLVLGYLEEQIDMKKIIRVFVALICTASTAARTESASASVKRVESIVSKMSLEEKIDYIGGTGFAIRAMPNLHLPAFELKCRMGPWVCAAIPGFPLQFMPRALDSQQLGTLVWPNSSEEALDR